MPQYRNDLRLLLNIRDHTGLGSACSGAHDLYLEECLKEDPRGLQHMGWWPSKRLQRFIPI